MWQERGDITPSFLADSLVAMNENHDIAYQEEVIKNVAGTLYTGRCFLAFRHHQFERTTLILDLLQPALTRYIFHVLKSDYLILCIDPIGCCIMYSRANPPPGCVEESTSRNRRCCRLESAS